MVATVREFYTGWLTHWGEKLAQTDAKSTAEALDDILRLNASVVLYVSSSTCFHLLSFGSLFNTLFTLLLILFYHGLCALVTDGSWRYKFRVYSGADTESGASDFQPDMTSYDYVSTYKATCLLFDGIMLILQRAISFTFSELSY